MFYPDKYACRKAGSDAYLSSRGRNGYIHVEGREKMSVCEIRLKGVIPELRLIVIGK